MSDNLISQLKKIAFNVRIQSEDTLGRAAKVSTVIKVLNDLNAAYLNFLEVEFNKNEEFAKIVQNKPRVLKNLLEDLELLVVDLKFGSFEAALAPALVESHTLFRDEVLEWEKNTFSQFKSVMLSGEYDNPKFMQHINERYTNVERLRMFKPLFASFGNGKDYVLNLSNGEGQITKRLLRPERQRLDFYLPTIPTEKVEANYKTSVIFAKVIDGHNQQLKKGSIKDILYWEEMEHDTYPYKPDLLKYDGLVYVLNERLDCVVSFENNRYFIQCEDLGIRVDASSREHAETDFAMLFHELYRAQSEGSTSRLKQRFDALVASVHQ